MAVAGGASSSVLVSSAKETAALKVNPADVPALEIKLGALAVLLSVTLLFGFAPLCIVRGAGRFSVQPDLRRLLLSLISCFAGGVFFATCLLDLLPDYLQSINEAFSSAGIKLQFPLPEFIVAMGFFLVLVLEQIILAFKDQTSPSPEERRSLLVDSSIQSNDHRRRGSRLRMKVLNICTPEDHNGLDYMAAFFHRWLQEPGRVVFIARIDGRVVALESALLVDGGQTAILQGRRVVSDLRGSGIAGAIQTHVTNYVRRYYPEVSAVRLSRGDDPSAQTLAKYRLITKEAILSLCCEAVDLGAFIAELRSKHPLHADSSCGPVTLSQRQAETLVLSDHVVSNLLPGRTVINDWEPLKPVEANLEVLRRRGLTWIVDRESEPAALSLSTPPYAVPYRHNAMCLNVNIFGRSLASVCAVFLAQLEAFLPSLKGYLVCHTYVDPALWAGFRQFCQNGANVSFFKDYWEEVILETDL